MRLFLLIYLLLFSVPVLITLFVLGLLSGPAAALAAETAASASTVLTVPYGEWIVRIVRFTAEALLPTFLAVGTGVLWKAAPWLQLFISTTMVETLVKNALDYALNSVEGAAKGQALSVDVGSRVVRDAVQRAVDQAPSWLLAKAGGPEGIAEKVFRKLNLDEKATAENTLAPAIAAIPTK